MDSGVSPINVLTTEHFLHELSRVPHEDIRALATKIANNPKMLEAVEVLQKAFDNPVT